MICYIPECIFNDTESFRLGSLHDDCVGLTGATPQFYSVAPYRFDNSNLKSIVILGTPTIIQLIMKFPLLY